MEDLAEKEQYHPTSVLNLGGGTIEITEIEDPEEDSDYDSDAGTSPRPTGFGPKPTKSLMREAEACEETFEDVCDHIESDRASHATFSSIELGHVDDRILRMDWLTELKLHDNGLEELPNNISLLRNLECLSVTSNQLSTLPASIGSLTSLTKVDLNHNRIVDLPEDFGNLTKLQECHLDFNKLTEIPAPLFKLSELAILGLVENCPLRSFASLQRFAVFKKIAVAIDNLPALVEEWKGWAENLPNVTIEWHKVFPDLILDFLFIGSLRTAQEQRVYDELKITRVLTCGTGMTIVLGEGMDQLLLPLADTVDANLKGHLATGINYIKEAHDKGEKVLVHCFAGLSRSASLCCAYLMQENRWTFAKALEFVRLGRPNAHPNDGFVAQLNRFEKELGISA
jgi:protein-tyrosine phosphatase|uniref:protein-tyrosine-phosphatase n=1 Tax=Eutreptiella gymnastica TaxID=73025 RepID=A0A6T2E1Q0_9EUGL|mmetsp:Transcript_78740/g.132090  ORF Transcript_78740/g.132090 Transcript_78740/m.132090 type:complete len:398 (+) Transcript_78740:64-1257(+)